MALSNRVAQARCVADKVRETTRSGPLMAFGGVRDGSRVVVASWPSGGRRGVCASPDGAIGAFIVIVLK
jgi:hypothetical protein